MKTTTLASSGTYSKREQPFPRNTDITQQNSQMLYQNQGRRQVLQQKSYTDLHQSKGIRMVKTNQPKDTFRTLDPHKIGKEEPLFQNKKQVAHLQQYQSTKENIFGQNHQSTPDVTSSSQNNSNTLRTNRSTTSQTTARSPSQKQALNLFAPDNNPPVYSTINVNNTSLKPEHFSKRLIKQNEYKMYDYGSSINLPNQQVKREANYDISQTERQTFNKAQTRRYQLDVQSSIDCLPGVFFKSPQQFKQPPNKEEAFMKRQLMTSVERESIDKPKQQKLKVNIKNEQSNEQIDSDSRPITKRQYEMSRGQYEQQYELKDSQQPIRNPDSQFNINKFRTQVDQTSISTNTRMNFYKTNFVLG